MSLPGFTAEASLVDSIGAHRWTKAAEASSKSQQVVPQLTCRCRYGWRECCERWAIYRDGPRCIRWVSGGRC